MSSADRYRYIRVCRVSERERERAAAGVCSGGDVDVFLTDVDVFLSVFLSLLDPPAVCEAFDRDVAEVPPTPPRLPVGPQGHGP